MAATTVTTKTLNLSTSFAPAGFDNNAMGGFTATITQALSMARSRDTGGRRRWFAEEREHQRQSHSKLRKSADPAGAHRRGFPERRRRQRAEPLGIRIGSTNKGSSGSRSCSAGGEATLRDHHHRRGCEPAWQHM